MATKVTIEGTFQVAKCETGDYGTNATLVEHGVPYPASLLVKLPEGHKWSKGQVLGLVMVCDLRQNNTKSGGKVTSYEITDYKKEEFTVKLVPVKPA